MRIMEVGQPTDVVDVGGAIPLAFGADAASMPGEIPAWGGELGGAAWVQPQLKQ